MHRSAGLGDGVMAVGGLVFGWIVHIKCQDCPVCINEPQKSFLPFVQRGVGAAQSAEFPQTWALFQTPPQTTARMAPTGPVRAESNHHFRRCLCFISGESLVRSLYDPLDAATVFESYKNCRNHFVMYSKAKLMIASIKEDDVDYYRAAMELSPPEHRNLHWDMGVCYFSFAWDYMLRHEAVSIFTDYVMTMPRPQAKLFMAQKESFMNRSVLSMALHYNHESFHANNGVTYDMLECIFSMEVDEEDIKELYARDRNGLNPIDSAISYSNSHKSKTCWTTPVLKRMLSVTGNMLADTLTPSHGPACMASSLTLAVIKGNIDAVQMLLRCNYRIKHKRGEISPVLAAIAFALHGMCLDTVNRLNIALILLSHPDLDINAVSSSGMTIPNAVAAKIPKLYKLDRFEAHTPLSYALAERPTHEANFSCIITAIFEHKALDVNKKPSSRSTKSMLEHAIVLRRYSVVRLIANHPSYRAPLLKKNGIPPSVRLCLIIDRMKQRCNEDSALRKRSPRGQKNKQILNEACKSLQVVALRETQHLRRLNKKPGALVRLHSLFPAYGWHASSVDNNRNCNWVAMKLNFMSLRMLEFRPRETSASTSGALRAIKATVRTLMLYAERGASKSLPGLPKELVVNILSFMSELDCVPTEIAKSTWQFI